MLSAETAARKEVEARLRVVEDERDRHAMMVLILKRQLAQIKDQLDTVLSVFLFVVLFWLFCAIILCECSRLSLLVAISWFVPISLLVVVLVWLCECAIILCEFIRSFLTVAISCVVPPNSASLCVLLGARREEAADRARHAQLVGQRINSSGLGISSGRKQKRQCKRVSFGQRSELRYP